MRPGRLAAVITFAGCFVATTTGAQELTTEALHNAIYQLTDSEIGTVTLKGCLANDAATGRRVNGTYHIAYADFDNDRAMDVVTVVVHQRNRDANVTADLVIMRNDSGKPKQLAASEISPTCLVRSLEVRGGYILLDVNTERVCDENICAYTKREIRRYAFRDGKLMLEYSESFPIDMPGVRIDRAEKQSAPRSIGARLLTFIGLDEQSN